MSVLFVLLWFVSTIMMVIGLIAPKLAIIPFAKKSRRKAFLSWFGIGFLCFIFAIATSPNDQSDISSSTKEQSTSTTKESDLVVDETSENAKTDESIEESSVEVVKKVEPVVVKDIYFVGEVADLDGTLIQVMNVEKSKGSDFDKPKEGNEYVIVTVAIKNNSDAVIDFNSYDFEMSNSKGQLTNSTFTIVGTETALSSGELLKNGFIEGTVTFEQPLNDSNLTLIYTPSFWKEDSIKFSIMKTLESFEKLVAGAIEIDEKTYYVGEFAQLDGAKMKVVRVERSAGAEFDKPKDGMEYIIVFVEIMNTGTENLSYNPYYFGMINKNGQVESQTFSMIDSETSLESGELLSGGSIEGTVVFEQLIGDTDLYLQYEDPSWFSDKKLLFSVGN